MLYSYIILNNLLFLFVPLVVHSPENSNLKAAIIENHPNGVAQRVYALTGNSFFRFARGLGET